MSNMKKTTDTIVLKPGKTVEIMLEENPSIGYRWFIINPEDGVVDVLRDYYAEGLESLGAAGEHIWKIKGLEKGETKLVFEYARSLEDNGVIEEKTFTVIVK